MKPTVEEYAGRNKTNEALDISIWRVVKGTRSNVYLDVESCQIKVCLQTKFKWQLI